MTQLTSEQAKAEIELGKKEVEDQGINPIQTFVYPFEDWNESVEQLVKNAGFLGARRGWGTNSGFNSKSADPYKLESKSPVISTKVAEVKQWVDTAITNNTWLILAFHLTDTSGGEYSFTPANFKEVSGYIKSKQVNVVTTQQGFDISK